MSQGINYKHVLFFCCSLQANGVFAAESGTGFKMPFGLRPVLSFVAGGSIATPGQSQAIMPVDLCFYRYNPSTSDVTQALWGAFLGGELNYNPSWGIVAGVGYYQPGNFTTTGILAQGADEVSIDRYQYRYRTQTQQILAEGRAVLKNQGRLQPFVMVGIGAAINKMHHFKTTVPPTYEFTPDFAARTKTNFTYSVGPGVDLSVTRSVRVGVSYRFTDLGSARSAAGQIDGIPFSNHLKQDHLYVNQLLAQITFVPWN